MTTSSDRLVLDKWKLTSPETGRPAILAWPFPIDAGGFIVDLHVRWPLAMDDHAVNRGNCRGHIHIVKRLSVPFQGIAEAESVTDGCHSTPVEDMGKKRGTLRKCLVRNAQIVHSISKRPGGVLNRKHQMSPATTINTGGQWENLVRKVYSTMCILVALYLYGLMYGEADTRTAISARFGLLTWSLGIYISCLDTLWRI